MALAGVFQLRIVTPREQLVDEEVYEVTAPGTLGEFGVFAEHITFLTSLEIGILSFRTDEGTRRMAIRGGFAEVANDVMTVLADDARFAEDVDTAAARLDLKAAELELQDLSPIDDRYEDLNAAVRWVQALLDVAGER